jgi:hypothetical protein
MKLLLDQGTPRSAATILRRAGFDAVHTGEIGLAEAEDSEIIRRAVLEDRRRDTGRRFPYASRFGAISKTFSHPNPH